MKRDDKLRSYYQRQKVEKHQFRKDDSEERKEPQEKIHQRIAEVSHTGMRKSRDPVYDLHESFKISFDELGLKAVNKETKTENPDFSEDNIKNPNLTTNADFPEYKHSLTELNGGAVYSRLTQSIFSQGKLASAIMLGEGKTMLISCLKRAVGGGAVNNSNQRELSPSSTRMNLKNSSERAIFNGVISGSIGLVVDTCKNLNITLTNIESMVKGERDDRNQLDDTETIRKLYPFLDTNSETELINRYKQESETTTDLAYKRALTSGINKLTGIMNAKNNMKNRFITHLRQILDASRKAEEEFSQEGFTESVLSELYIEPETNEDDEQENNEEDK